MRSGCWGKKRNRTVSFNFAGIEGTEWWAANGNSLYSGKTVKIKTQSRRSIKYRVIHKSLRDFRPLRYSSRDGHPEGEHVNRGRDTPSFCPTSQVLDMSNLGDAADVKPVIKFLPHMLHVCGRNLECLSLC